MTSTYRDATEVAKIVRRHIKSAVQIGALPDVKYSVRSSKFAGGQSVDITLVMDEERAWVPTEPTDVEFLRYRMDKKLSDEVRSAGAWLKVLAGELGHDGRSFFIFAYVNGGTMI